MALPLSLPFTAVVLFGALFGGGGETPALPAQPVPNATSSDVAATNPATREKTEVWAVRTWPLHFRNPNTNETVDVRLYTDEGHVDAEALAALTAIVNPDGEPESERVLLLVARAAYFFGATNVEALSGHRTEARAVQRTSKHTTGEALDFKLDHVDSGLLAAHLRTYGQVGVGVYTHPGTRYVHLDTRDTSFHWIDASPPGRAWREQGMTDKKSDARDRAWTTDDDKPLFLSVAVPKRR
jgi:hypothetical protein